MRKYPEMKRDRSLSRPVGFLAPPLVRLQEEGKNKSMICLKQGTPRSTVSSPKLQCQSVSSTMQQQTKVVVPPPKQKVSKRVKIDLNATAQKSSKTQPQQSPSLSPQVKTPMKSLNRTPTKTPPRTVHILAQLLPDFGMAEQEQSENDQIEIQLPEINITHLKGITSLNLDDFYNERKALAKKIMRSRKRILATTPDYYRMCYVIGRGAFAKVCLGVQVLTGMFVAMKIIEKSSLKTENAKKRVLQEITLLKQLAQYPQIVRLYEVFETKKQIFIITEYVKDGDLSKFVKENGGLLTESSAKSVFAQILLILLVLQKHNILHRDIKLDNLLLDGKLVKVCDFGVSKVITKGQRITDQCGTPAYLAPEVLKGCYEGYQSDVWSLGVLLYIMVVGKVPFKGNSMNELNQSIQSGHLNFMEMKQAGLSTECMEILRKMLTINPKLRITTEQIVEHPWLKSESKLFTRGEVKRPNNHDPKIINLIEQYGYQKDYIYKSLQKGSVCHINALYAALTK